MNCTIRVQSILFNVSSANVERALEYLDNAAKHGRTSRASLEVSVAYGDCSPERALNSSILNEARRRLSNLSGIEYTHFGSNLGSAAGHNRLLEDATSDLIMILNPDVLAAPNLFEEMLSALDRPGVGLVEARQLPIEHPKEYDPLTGETSWASTACAMAPTQMFRNLRGFDSDTFFLYCDDVDFSWRLRLSGFKVVHQCAAVVFHDKRLNEHGGWISSGAERYYSAEAALLLPYKYSRPDLVEQYLRVFRESTNEDLQKAARAFDLRATQGRLPVPIDADHRVAQFIDGGYARHRFASR